MWTMFGDLGNLKTNHRVDRIFRIVAYGAIVVLLCFADAVFERPVDGAATGYRYLAAKVFITTSLVGVLAFLLLRSLRPRGAFPIQSLSPNSRRLVRAVSIISSVYLLLFIGVAYCLDLLGKGPMVAGICVYSPLWLPLLLIVVFLSGGLLKRGLALAVAMYFTLFLVSISILSNLRDWEDPWWIQSVPSLAALSSVIMIGTAVWTYYTLKRESHDLSMLLGPFSYSIVLLFLLVVVTDPEERDRQAIHAQMAKTKLEEINRAASTYATHFGGVFPENLAALASPPQSQTADCRAAGLVQKLLTTDSGGYIFEYRTGFPSRTAPGGCEGAMHYTITARPAVYGKTGHVNLYTDESGDIRCSYQDRPANSQDFRCNFSRHLP